MTFSRAAWARTSLVAAGCAGYAWLAYRNASQTEPSLASAALGFAPLAALALWLAWHSPMRLSMLGGLALAGAVGWEHADVLMRHYRWAYLTQHAGAMILFGTMFGRTLLPGQEPMVTRFARHDHASLSLRVERYTRGVTWAWTVFFGAMAATSLALFVIAPPRLWALFADGLTPLLVLAVFVAEYLVRLRALPADERSGPIQAVLAYARYRADIRRRAGTEAPPEAGRPTLPGRTG